MTHHTKFAGKIQVCRRTSLFSSVVWPRFHDPVVDQFEPIFDQTASKKIRKLPFNATNHANFECNHHLFSCNHPPSSFATIRHFLQPSAIFCNHPLAALNLSTTPFNGSGKRQLLCVFIFCTCYCAELGSLRVLPLPACRFFCPKPCVLFARPPHESSLPVTTARSLRQKSFTQRVLTSEIKCTARLRIILQQNIFFWTRKFCQAMFFFPLAPF